MAEKNQSSPLTDKSIQTRLIEPSLGAVSNKLLKELKALTTTEYLSSTSTSTSNEFSMALKSLENDGVIAVSPFNLTHRPYKGSISISNGEAEKEATYTLDYIDKICRITFNLEGNVIIGSAFDYFNAFCQIRLELEKDGLFPLCYGASLNVLPFPQLFEDQLGLITYKLAEKSKTAHKDLVFIFERGNDIEPATVAKQLDYWSEW